MSRLRNDEEWRDWIDFLIVVVTRLATAVTLSNRRMRAKTNWTIDFQVPGERQIQAYPLSIRVVGRAEEVARRSLGI
jgi:hypothetical protein